MTHSIQFEVSAGADSPMTLHKAILLYRGCADQTFATVHDIGSAADGVPVLLDGKPLTPSAAVRLAKELSANAVSGGFLPPTLLFLDGDAIAWWVPPGRRHVAFRAPELGAPERGAVVPHPGLVFSVSNRRRWHVWAVKWANRPAATTPMFQAPYFNVADDGAICAGNVTLPNGTTAEKIDAWNRAFFGSFFTHPNAGGRLVKYTGGAFPFWRDMLDGHFAEFPEKALVPCKATLAQVLGVVR